MTPVECILEDFEEKPLFKTYRGKHPNKSRDFSTSSQCIETDKNTGQDHLYQASYVHKHRSSERCSASYDNLDSVCAYDCDRAGCEQAELVIRTRHESSQINNVVRHHDAFSIVHFGRFGSANTVMKSGIDRDRIAAMENLIAFEMEGPVFWDEHPTIVIKAASDYADSHENKILQPYAARIAALWIKVVLAEWVVADEFKKNDRLTEPVALGLCLSSAPFIQPDDFVVRITEIKAMHNALCSNLLEQQRVVLGGMGGVGKTQLAIVYARRYEREYTSVLWLDASSEQNLYMSLRSLACSLITASELEKLSSEQILFRVHEWLSHADNRQWLLIFDNHDDPDQFGVNGFCPTTGHGSVLITTRLPDMVPGHHARVRPLTAVEDSLNFLQKRSGRKNLRTDVDACRLVERVGGLPLALVTAGVYFRKSTITFKQYLDVYEQRWQVDPRRPPRLQDYQSRTLYTTWSLSYSQLKTEDPEAAHVLKLLAYFDNQDLWNELLKIGLSKDPPAWLVASLRDQATFESIMGRRTDYCFVEVQHTTQSYTIHSCIHDWTLRALNEDIDMQLYWCVFDCVTGSIDSGDWDNLGAARYSQLSRHGVRPTHHRFKQCHQLDSAISKRLIDTRCIAIMLEERLQYAVAERMALLALNAHERIRGPDHPSTFGTVHHLALLHGYQGNFNEAEQIYIRAVNRAERESKSDRDLVLVANLNLGCTHWCQGKDQEAEEMFLRTIAGDDKSPRRTRHFTLKSLYHLGDICHSRRRLDKAQQIYTQALTGYKESHGSQHILTLMIIPKLGDVHVLQGDLDEAEQLFQEALAGYQKTLGSGDDSIHQVASKLRCLGQFRTMLAKFNS